MVIETKELPKIIKSILPKVVIDYLSSNGYLLANEFSDGRTYREVTLYLDSTKSKLLDSNSTLMKIRVGKRGATYCTYPAGYEYRISNAPTISICYRDPKEYTEFDHPDCWRYVFYVASDEELVYPRGHENLG